MLLTNSLSLHASDDLQHATHYHWPTDGILGGFDSKSLRRGYEVYRQVCSTCHSMNLINYRNLVGVSHSEDQAVALAKSVEIKDGPNDAGLFFDRPRKLSDPFPSPYDNEEAARSANGGALPPDLSLITKAREGGADYVFSLLTGYAEPPEGVTLRDGLHYNPYFPGGAISMAPPLMNEGVEYEDGTEASVSQQAKDVAHFLTWTAEPELDARKKMGFESMVVLGSLVLMTGYHKRFRWNTIKNVKIRHQRM